jgi:hypothetical protein
MGTTAVTEAPHALLGPALSQTAQRGMRAEHADVVLRTAFEVDLLG